MKKNNFLASFPTTGWLILLSLAVRVCLFALYQPWEEPVVQKILISDALQYYQLAEGILSDISFATFGAFRTPLYPLFLALIFAVTGTHVWAALLFQILLDVGTTLLGYLLAKEIFASRKTAHYAMLFYSIDLLAAAQTLQLMTETLFTFIFTGAVLATVYALKRGNIKYYALGGMYIGLATLVRPVAQYLGPTLALFALFSRKLFGHAAVFVGVFFLVLSFWQIRNYAKFGHYALSTIDGYNLLEYNAAKVKSLIEHVSLDEARSELHNSIDAALTNPFDRASAQQKIAIAYLRQHPWWYSYYHIKGGVNMMLGTAKTSVLPVFKISPLTRSDATLSENFFARVKRTLSAARQEYWLTPLLFIVQLIEYALSAIGFAAVRKTENKYLIVLIAILIAYFFLITGVVGTARYRAPIVPLYLVMSAYGLERVINFYTQKHLLRR